MSPLFRVIILLVCLGTTLFLHRSIRKSKMRIEESIFWLLFSILLLVFAIFPFVPDFMAMSLGIYSTPNFLFLLVIFILLLRLFHTHVELGKLEEKVNRIVQDMALKESEERDRIQHLKKEQEACK